MLSRRLGLAQRIACRTLRLTLDEELGVERGALTRVYGSASVYEEALLEVTREVATAAASRGIRVVLLKGMALLAAGRSTIGARGAGDTDILVSDEDLPALAAALEDRGFHRIAGGPSSEHQLPSFHRAEGENVDLHRFLPGVRLRGHRGFADVAGLAEVGLLDPAPTFPPGTFVPALPVLIAHALAHGIAQHGFAPQSYPLMRLVSDLVDLGAGRPAAKTVWTQAVSLVEADVPPSEATAAWDVCERLTAGTPLPSLLPRAGIAADTLLAHLLASALDADYREGLRLRVFGSGPSLLPYPVRWLRDVARSLWPSKAQLRALDGRAGMGGLGARVLRPPTQVARALRAAWHGRRARRRSPAASALESIHHPQ